MNSSWILSFNYKLIQTLNMIIYSYIKTEKLRFTKKKKMPQRLILNQEKNVWNHPFLICIYFFFLVLSRFTHAKLNSINFIEFKTIYHDSTCYFNGILQHNYKLYKYSFKPNHVIYTVCLFIFEINKTETILNNQKK